MIYYDGNIQLNLMWVKNRAGIFDEIVLKIANYIYKNFSFYHYAAKSNSIFIYVAVRCGYFFSISIIMCVFA